MTDSHAEASDTDLAEQALPADGGFEDDEAEVFSEDVAVDAEADTADLLEQQHSVPSPDDDYDR